MNSGYVVGASLQDIQAEANWLSGEIQNTHNAVVRELNKKYGGKSGNDWMLSSTSVAGRAADRSTYDGWMEFRDRWDKKKQQIDGYYFGTDARLAEEKAFEAEWRSWHQKWGQRLPGLAPIVNTPSYPTPGTPGTQPGTPGTQPGTPGTPGTQPGTPGGTAPPSKKEDEGIDPSYIFFGVIGLAAVGGVAYFMYKKSRKPQSSSPSYPMQMAQPFYPAQMAQMAQPSYPVQMVPPSYPMLPMNSPVRGVR